MAVEKKLRSSLTESYALIVVILLVVTFSAMESDARTVTRKVTDDEGNVYEGELRDGVRHGTGRMEWIDGTVYEGDFREGKIHGSGKMSDPDGEVYTGTFDSEIRHGYGNLVFQNGDVYEGSFVKGVISGEGSYQEKATGNSYSGLFLKGKRHGEGTLIYEDGRKYQGWFREGLKEGFGELLQANGKTYRGFFSKDVRHGAGVLDDKEQDSLHFQSWDNGELVSNELIEVVENCRLVIEGQDWMFNGEQCMDGLAHGEGRAVNKDGSAYISYGKFVLGVRTSGAIVSLTNPSGGSDGN